MSMEKRLLEEFVPPTYEEWVDASVAALKGKPFEKLFMKTYEGITTQPIYRRVEAENLEHLKNNLPGEYPFVRGTKADGYKKEIWDVEQEINYAMPDDFNAALRRDLMCGQNTVALRFNEDVFTQVFKNKAEKSCPGTVVRNLEDMKAALDGVLLDCCHVHLMPTNYPVVFFSLFNAYLKSQNLSLADVKGVFRIDPLGSLAKHGEIKTDAEHFYKAMALILKKVVAKKSALRTIEVDTSVYTDGGANAVQEIAYALATAVEYIRGVGNNGVDIKDIASHLSFTCGVGANFFMEIAKLRALRMLWAKVAKEFGADVEGQKIHMHTKTAKLNKTKLDQYVNMLRVTIETLAAVVAGTDAHTVTPFDAQFGLPKDFSRRISRNVQLFLAEECNMRDSIDPAGGSWYVETMTATLAEKGWEMFQQIEANGGMYKELLAGNIQTAVKAIHDQRVKSLSTRKDVIVGTNRFPNGNERDVDVITYDYEAAFNHVKANLNSPAAAGKADALKDVAADEKICAITEAFINGANVYDVIGKVCCQCCCNTTVTAEKIDVSRLAEAFEAIRAASAEYKAHNGFAPKIFLANMGILKQHKPRADFAQDFFATGGFDIIYNQGFMSNQETAKAAIESDAKIIVICSTDDTYPDIVPEVAKTIKAANPDKFIVLAGYPTEFVEQFKEAGVDEFIHVKANIYNVLLAVQKQLGIA